MDLGKQFFLPYMYEIILLSARALTTAVLRHTCVIEKTAFFVPLHGVHKEWSTNVYISFCIKLTKYVQCMGMTIDSHWTITVTLYSCDIT